jgi:single-strand DNA-binding protein
MSTPSINALTIAGNLTRDPQLKFLANENAVCAFGIANSRKRKAGTDQVEDVVFLDCEAWGKTAEMIAKWFTKGKPILCEGRIKQETWDDKTTGAKRSKLLLVVERCHFLNDAKHVPAAPSATDPATAPTTPAAAPRAADAGGDEPPF